MKKFGGTPNWVNKYSDKEIATIGATPSTILQHPRVPRQTGWEPLL